MTLSIDPVLMPTQPIQWGPCFETEKRRLNHRGQGPVHIYILHAHVHKTHTRTQTHIYTTPQRPLRCLADGAGIVSFNDGEASPAEASVSSILSGVLCRLSTPTWHQCRAEERQRGMFKSQWRAGGKKLAFDWIKVCRRLRNNTENRSLLIRHA